MRTREDLEAEALRSGCRLVDVYRDEHGRIVGEWECPDAEEGRPMATAMLLEGLLDGDAAAREIPEGVTRILRAQGPRAARMAHAFVRQRVEFRPEETETFQSPGATLALGYGDCDDSARALVALARAAGIAPFVAVAAIPERSVSLAVTVSRPTVLSTTPFGNSWLPASAPVNASSTGSDATGSVDVKWSVPR